MFRFIINFLLMLEARVKDIPKFEAGFDNCVIPGPIF
jgi:hypothetical protein